MNKRIFFFLNFVLLLTGITVCDQRLEKMSHAIQKGDLTQTDYLLTHNQYTYPEYDFLIAQADGIVHESKGWWIALWLMMILGALIAFKACWEGIKLARKAPKYDSANAIIAGVCIAILGIAGAYIGIKGFNKYNLYTKAPEISLRLQAAKRSAAPLISSQN